MAGFALAEEPFEDWLRQRRQHFETVGTAAFESLAQHCDRMGRGAQAIATVERLLAFDPLREDRQRLALRLYARHRSQREALAQAQAFSDLLQRQLGVEPELQTQDLIEEIGRGAFAPAPPRAATPQPNAVAPDIVATPVGETKIEDPAPHPLATQIAVSRLAGQWPTFWQPPRRGLAAVAVTAASILLVGFAALFIGRSASPPAVAISASPDPGPAAADPWRPPRQKAATGKYLIPILVLPFKTYGETAGPTRLLADMMLDDLIGILARVPFLRVIGRATSRSYAGRPIDVATIGKELGVRYILDGSMRMHGGKLRVNVELVSPATRLSAWSGRIERDSADRHGVRDEIVGRLARELQFEVFMLEGELRAKDEDTAALVYRGHADPTRIREGLKLALGTPQ
jgi:TolB-like protein